MDVDMGKLPEPHRLSPTTEPQSIPTLDGWIENLMNCKQLAENDVQRLCDRVRNMEILTSRAIIPGPSRLTGVV
jgi:serine/threonine-protein phosphatase 2A catalytic subunit